MPDDADGTASHPNPLFDFDAHSIDSQSRGDPSEPLFEFPVNTAALPYPTGQSLQVDANADFDFDLDAVLGLNHDPSVDFNNIDFDFDLDLDFKPVGEIGPVVPDIESDPTQLIGADSPPCSPPDRDDCGRSWLVSSSHKSSSVTQPVGGSLMNQDRLDSYLGTFDLLSGADAAVMVF